MKPLRLTADRVMSLYQRRIALALTAHRLLCVTVALVLNVAQPDEVFIPDLNRFPTFFW
jgi:hypothetical protein